MAKSMCKTFIYPESSHQRNISGTFSKENSRNMKIGPPNLFKAANIHDLNLLEGGFFPQVLVGIFQDLLKNSRSRVLNRYSVDTVGITFYEKLSDN
jgi:hypothetical protein